MPAAQYQYLNSKETKKKLKISSCDLMHMRVAGKLRYEKLGNAFWYDKSDIEQVKQKRKRNNNE